MIKAFGYKAKIHFNGSNGLMIIVYGVRVDKIRVNSLICKAKTT